MSLITQFKLYKIGLKIKLFMYSNSTSIAFHIKHYPKESLRALLYLEVSVY